MTSDRPDSPVNPALSRDDVEAAARRIDGLVIRTPVVTCAALDHIAGASLFLKAENLQRIGAFKARGAFNTLAQMTDGERRAGVITYSSGNHAQAVALAARHYGVPARIAMPEDAPTVKVDVVRALGAEITFAGTTSEHRKAAAAALVRDHGGTVIEPFDHPHTIAGQGTATLELLAQVAEAGHEPLDAVIVPVGGGGLIAGACLACEGSSVAVHGVEPSGCDSFARSVEAGCVTPVEPGPTLADGLKPTRVGQLNFAIAGPRVAGCHRIDDDDLARATMALLFSAKLLAEPSGAAALAVALARRIPGARRIGILVSGGNVAPATVQSILDRPAPPAA